MSEYRIKKGYDVPMIGTAEGHLVDGPTVREIVVRPNEFRMIKPKLLVRDGDTVSIGSPLFQDRKRPEIRFVSPAGGTVQEICFGRRRVCEEIRIRISDSEDRVEFPSWSPTDARQLSRPQIVEALLDSGLWTSIRQRPFNTIPDPESAPEAIFIAASDSSPLAFDSSLALPDRDEDFQLGVDLLGKLTEGKVHIGTASNTLISSAVRDAKNCDIHGFSGPYPSGQIEVQAHLVLPYKKGRVVWHLDCQDVADIGERFRTGAYPVKRVVAVGGEGSTVKKHFHTRRGVTAEALDPEASPARNRFVSGNILSGNQVRCSSGLGHYDNKFCIIPEGDIPEFVGWMLPGVDKVSRFRSYASSMIPGPKTHNTSLGGGVRAHVATGIYEDVCAVDILPPYLMKSILANDYEEIEALGLHDCAECGLCTYVCPSKIEFGQIISNGIEDLLKEEEA